jgi:hypothetical protein
MSSDLYSFLSLWRQYRSCRSNKRNTFNALAFEIASEAQLLALQAELRDHSYRPGRSICFVTDLDALAASPCSVAQSGHGNTSR